MASGQAHSCALIQGSTSRTVKCWGANQAGQLGTGTNLPPTSGTPVTVANLAADVVAIAAGTGHTCAQRANGQVWCWGLNSSGQLGNDSTTRSFDPVAASGLSTAKGLELGEMHSCISRYTGIVRCWGKNGNGQIGDGTTTDALTYQNVSGFTDVLGPPAPGAIHTCALHADGSASCWGSNALGRLGIGDQSGTEETPVPVLFFP